MEHYKVENGAPERVGGIDIPDFQTAVTITSYTQNNKYTAPVDGYAMAFAGGGDTHTQILIGNGYAGAFADASLLSGMSTSVFVKKGTKIWIDTTKSRNGAAFFVPIEPIN